MLTARLRARRGIAHLLILAIACTGIFIGAASLATSSASACPEPPPQPLRVLYTSSERIVVGEVAKTEQVQAGNAEDESRLLKTTLRVSSTLKGAKPEATVDVYHWVWGEYPTPLSEAKSGDQLLLFLNKREEGEPGYQIDDINYGFKKLSDADLKVYVKRINELAAILNQADPNKAELIEWLVRLVEEPATRWEGAFELQSSSQAIITRMENQTLSESEVGAENVEYVTEEVVATEGPAVDGEHAEGEAIDYAELYYQADESLVTGLTAAQKERVAQALFGTQTLTDKDYPLISLINDWKDPRLTQYLLSRLKNSAMTPEYLPEVMNIIATNIGDEELKTLVEDYRNSLYGGVEGVAEPVEGEEETAETQARREQAFQEQLGARLDRFIALAQGRKA